MGMEHVVADVWSHPRVLCVSAANTHVQINWELSVAPTSTMYSSKSSMVSSSSETPVFSCVMEMSTCGDTCGDDSPPPFSTMLICKFFSVSNTISCLDTSTSIDQCTSLISTIMIQIMTTYLFLCHHFTILPFCLIIMILNATALTSIELFP